MKTLTQTIYGVFGTLAIALSALALIQPAAILSTEADSPLMAHLIREQGAEGVFIGLMAFWCLFNFDGRRPVHLALVVFAALFAAIHWAEYFHGRRTIISPLGNSLPFLALFVVTPFRSLSNPSRAAGSPLARPNDQN